MYYPQETIEQVIDANNIVDVISEYVKLNKRGSTYFGLCPFHNEKTPSFSVTDNGDRKMFYCFGCHAGGNVITFLMKYESMTYTEALRALAERAGITLPQPEYSREDAERFKRREQILEVYKEAAVYYYHLLRSPKGSQAMAYLKNRQLSDETIRSFGLGYSSKYRDDLYRYIKSKGFQDDILKETGLFSIKETGVHDYFWNRVMFPIMDTRNKVIAFGGRVMGDAEPKYLNSPETMVFEKRRNLFGLHIARKHKGQELILCEGYMDVISLHQAGFTNAVASLGTALTSSHAGVLKRFTSRVFLSYDSDNAGRSAAIRAIPILREAGISARIIDLKPYKDPDELIKAEGAAAYRQRMNSARNSLLFEIDVLQEGYDLSDPDSKTRFYHEVARRLSLLDDEMEMENYLRTVSMEFRIDYEMLRSRTRRLALNREGGRTYAPEPIRRGTSARENRPTALSESMKILLSHLAQDPGLVSKLEGVLDASDFSIPPYDQIAALLFDQAAKGKVSVSGIIGSFAEEEDQEKAAQILLAPGDEAQDRDGAQEHARLLNDCVINIRRHTLEARIASETNLAGVLELRKEQESLNSLRLF